MITYLDLKLYYITFDNDDLAQVYTTYAFVWKIGTRWHHEPVIFRSNSLGRPQFQST